MSLGHNMSAYVTLCKVLSTFVNEAIKLAVSRVLNCLAQGACAKHTPFFAVPSHLASQKSRQ
eukprot:1364851-Amphidinium_carterae.1